MTRLAAPHEQTTASARAWRVFPGGSNGEFGLPPRLTPVIRDGSGCLVHDSEGREYLDLTMGWGSVLLGHGHAGVTAAVIRQAPLGANFAHLNAASLAVAERLVGLCPACERIRFCASGTEATMHCIRLARAARGRAAILKFEGAYHGSHDLGTTSLFGRRLPPFPEPEPLGRGMPVDESRQVLVAPFNDPARAAALISGHAADLAAVIVEPLHRCLPPEPGFLEAVREACDRTGVLLVFDEVVTGFRLARGGAQERYGVIPDLVAYGKALGGGYPIGAYGGRADLMDLVDEARIGGDDYVWTASTLGGNPVSCAAALAFLDAVSEPGFYQRLHHLGEYLRQGMRGVLAGLGVEATVIGDGPLAQVVFRSGPVRSSRELWQGDSAAGRRLMLALFERGVFLNPMGTKLYLSAAHDEAACDRFLDVFRAALPAAASAGHGR